MEYINLLIQIPLVGIFVWFVIHMTGRTTDFIEKRDQRFLEELTKLRECVDRMGRQVTLNTAIILLVYRKSGEADGVTKELIDQVMREYETGEERRQDAY